MEKERIYEGLASRCCEAPLEDAPKDYKYVKLNPDTRWYLCSECRAHWGYHRMRKNWRVDPYDYSNNSKVRAALGLD